MFIVSVKKRSKLLSKSPEKGECRCMYKVCVFRLVGWLPIKRTGGGCAFAAFVCAYLRVWMIEGMFDM